MCDTLIYAVTNILYALFLFSMQLLEVDLSSTFGKRAEVYSSKTVSVLWKGSMLPREPLPPSFREELLSTFL